MASFNLPFKRKYFKKTPIHIVENHDEVRTTSNDKSVSSVFVLADPSLLFCLRCDSRLRTTLFSPSPAGGATSARTIHTLAHAHLPNNRNSILCRLLISISVNGFHFHNWSVFFLSLLNSIQIIRIIIFAQAYVIFVHFNRVLLNFIIWMY